MTQDAHETADDTLTMDTLLRHGLEQQPFDATAGDTFLYTDPVLDMVVGVLLEHLRNDDSLLLLKGDAGAGKSTQLLRLLGRGADTLEFCAFKARPDTSFAAVDFTIRKYWDRFADGEPLALEELLCKVAAAGRRPVVVIDDAHHLDAEILSELIRVRREVRQQCDVMPGLLLVGDPVLEVRLEQASEADAPKEPHISVQLRPLTREQTEAYLRHRLQAAGADDPDLLSGDAALTIHLESAGLPLRMNAAANRWLRSLATASGVWAEPSTPQPPKPPVWQHRWFRPVVLIIVAVGVVAILLSLFSSPDEPLETRELLVLPEPRPLTAPEAPPLPAEPEPPAEAPPAPDTPPEPLAETPDEPPGTETPPAPEARPVPADPAPATEAPGEAPPAPARVQETAALHDAIWIREQPAGHYTIQVLGLSDLQALRRYGSEQGLDMELAWFRTLRDGQDWYVLVAGRYPDAETARAAIAGLPEDVRRHQPWVRSFGSVQEAMAAAR
jgi:DamX protein